MDFVWLASFLIVVALAFYALERIPFPSTPPWLRRGVEAIVAILCLVILMQRAGIALPH